MADFFINIPESGSASWKAVVDTAADLPAAGNNIGDARITQDTQTIYVWDGTNWLPVATPGAAIALDGLIGDVTATGPGVAPATIQFVGGVSAANVATGANLANAATSSNTPNTIVKRDGGGSFSTQQITLATNPTTNLQTSTKQYVDNFPAINGLQNTGYSLSPVYGSTANTITQGNDARLSTTNLIKVKQNPGAGEFSSVTAALASITTNSISNPFEVLIGPGIYTESQIVLKPYVSLSGYTQQSTILTPSNANQAFIIGADFSTLAHVTIKGATGLNGVGVQYSSSLASSEFLVKDCVFGSNTTLLYCQGNSSTETILNIINSLTTPDITFTTGFKVDSSGGIKSRIVASGIFIDVGNSGTSPTDFFLASGTGSRLFISDTFSIGTFSSPGGNGIHCLDGAVVRVVGTNFINNNRFLWVENSGAAPNLAITGVHTDGNNHDIVIDHTGTTGSLEGSFQVSNSTISSSTVSFLTTDPTDGITFTGDLNFGPTFNTRTDVTDLILQSPTMGLYSGGDLSSGGGFLINVAAGNGYFSTGIPASFFNWSSTSITLSASTTNYIYFNSSGSLVTNSNFPNTENVILLGRAVTNVSGIEFIDDSPLDASHYGNLNDNFMRNAIGSVYQFGSIVSENATPKHLNVTAGSYYFSNSNFLPSAGVNINFDTFYRNGSGGFVIGTTNVVDTSNYDNGSGTLQPIPANQYARHTLYLVGESPNQKYFFVYSQVTFGTLTQAENGNIPTPPPYFTDGVVLIASLIVKQGATSIVAGGGEIIDNRPRIGFAIPAVSAVGTVSSVALLDGSTTPIYTITGSPITSSGTLTFTLNTETANRFFAGPTTGSPAQPTFRSIVNSDLSTITTLSSLVLPTSQLSGQISLTTQVSGILPSANGGTGINNSFNLTIAGTSSINGTFSGTSSGSNTGDVTLAAVGASPNANAASLSGQVLNLQPASASFPGVITTGTQTLTGAKTFSNDLAITSNSTTALTINSTSFIFDATNNALGIGTQPTTTTFIDGINSTGSTKRFVLTGYGVGSTVGTRGRFARGTSGSPSAVNSGDILNFLSGQGYGASQFPSASTGTMNVTAGETFTNTSNATYLTFNTTPSGSVTTTERMRINSTGNILIGTTTDNGNNQLQVAGSFLAGTSALTDAANIATNSALANRFTVTLAGNRNLSAPTNPTDGQKVIWIFTQDATGNRTLTFDAIFDFGNMPTLILSSGAAKRDYMGAIYNSAAVRWDVVAYSNTF